MNTGQSPLPRLIEVRVPGGGTRRLLFAYDPVKRIVVQQIRGVRYAVHLSALEMNPTDPAASVTFVSEGNAAPLK